jgi:hypothetical protein
MKKVLFFLVLIFPVVACHQPGETRSPEASYQALQNHLATGWNTWDTYSCLTHVLLPQGLGIQVQFATSDGKYRLREGYISRDYDDIGVAGIIPGAHAYDGSYTDLSLNWKGMHLRVQSAWSPRGNIIFIKPLDPSSGNVIVNAGMWWQRSGKLKPTSSGFIAEMPNDTIPVYIFPLDGKMLGSMADSMYRKEYSLGNGLLVVAGDSLSPELAIQLVRQRADSLEKAKMKYARHREVYDAMQTVLAWNVIYEPVHNRVIAPVSRIWNKWWGGYVLFCWDSYFASYMLAAENKELAYAMAAEITNEITPEGFVPNFGAALNYSSRDRSQPPVGSMMVREIYRKYREKWFPALLYDKLLMWNRWWPENRQYNGLLCWGSNPYTPGESEKPVGVNSLLGAALESGLDNSPMYDNMPFDTVRHIMLLADVGLTSLYIADCEALADLALQLGRKKDAQELTERAAFFRRNMEKLWDEQTGLYLNMRLDSGSFTRRLSPTHFYPLIARIPDQKRAERMIREHFYNPDEFWGTYILPSIARNDPAFYDNNYWRGRIWAPMNFLVYLGLRNYDLPVVRHDLSQKSADLLLKGWREKRQVYENYNSVTGQGNDVTSSDWFYHWGGLLGVISLIEDGFLPAPEKPL